MVVDEFGYARPGAVEVADTAWDVASDLGVRVDRVHGFEV